MVVTVTPSPDQTYITPGVGSIIDSLGNVYTVTSAGVATEAIGGANPKPMVGGGGIFAVEYYSGNVYFQSKASLTWYTWQNGAFVVSVVIPPVPPNAMAGVLQAIQAAISGVALSQANILARLTTIQTYITGQTQ